MKFQFLRTDVHMCSDKHSSLTNIVLSLSIKIFCIYSMMDGDVIVIHCGS